MYFLVFSNCIPVKGHTRSAICDLQRNKIDYIPNSLFDILTDKSVNTIDGVKEKYDHQFDETIDEYFAFLIENEYVFLTRNPDLYPPLNTEWHYPFPISNAIIDIAQESPSAIKSLAWLEASSCKNVQIRFFRNAALDEISTICQFLQETNSGIQFLQILLPYSHEFEIKYPNLYHSYPRLSNLTFYNAPFETFMPPVHGNRGYTVLTTKNISSCMDCGVIDFKRHAINIQNYTETLQFNSCLNRKISIDTGGNIKNCPSMKSSFGKVGSTSITEVLADKRFTDLWNIKKDDIKKCRDCEFRYICTDCRAYLEQPEDLYSKPLKCNYDPYTGEVADWSTDKFKETARSYYNFKELQYDIVAE